MSRARRPAPPLVLAVVSVVAAACANGGDGAVDVPSDAHVVDGIDYRAETAIAESFPVQLFTTVTATNTSGIAAQLVFPDGCIVTLRAYDDESRAGEPVWDQARALMCTQALEERTVPGGGSIELDGSASAQDVLGDSLPDGRYWLEAVLRPNGDTVRLPAGAADLAVPRG